MVEILCTITGVVAGIAIVASFMHSKEDASRWLVRKAPDNDPEQPENIRGIAAQLRMLTFRVAADVTAHNERVEAISGRLAEPQAEQPAHILSAVNELISVNEQMQGQLADARKRIADQTELIEEVAQQARTDALTGLANRRALNEFLQCCLDAIQPNECAGILLLDIDHFKAFNDTYGHTTGDAVLAAFARNIKKSCNQECYAARYGGEEFAVILTGRDASSVACKSTAIRKFVSQQSINYEDLELKITASAGLCLLVPGDTLQTAYDRADEGLYRAKKAGRNQGYLLHAGRWQPFPEEGDAELDDQQPADAQSVLRKTTKAADPTHKSKPALSSAAKPSKTSQPRGNAELASTVPTSVEPVATQTPKAIGEVLDLATFMNRSEVYIDQLRRAELPATGMLIEAQWDVDLDPRQSHLCWTSVLGLIQSQLRGIDIVCIFRENTAGIFLPGCSIDAAGERASRIQHLLESARQQWQPAEHCPDRLSIAIAQAMPREGTGEFLQRLEDTLDEASLAGRTEFVIHSGKNTRIETTIQA